MPSQLGLLTKLNYLNLQSTSLSQQIPISLCSLYSRASGGNFYLTVSSVPLLTCYPACMSPAVLSSTYFVKDATLARVCTDDFPQWQNDMQVLEDLYVTTNGPTKWNYGGNGAAVRWNFVRRVGFGGYYMQDPCSYGWSGVTCVADSHGVMQIKRLSLASFGLAGPIPNRLFTCINTHEYTHICTLAI